MGKHWTSYCADGGWGQPSTAGPATMHWLHEVILVQHPVEDRSWMFDELTDGLEWIFVPVIRVLLQIQRAMDRTLG